MLSNWSRLAVFIVERDSSFKFTFIQRLIFKWWRKWTFLVKVRFYVRPDQIKNSLMGETSARWICFSFFLLFQSKKKVESDFIINCWLSMIPVTRLDCLCGRIRLHCTFQNNLTKRDWVCTPSLFFSESSKIYVLTYSP